MLNIDFFYPTICVQIGTYFIRAGIALDVYSSKESYFDWAKIRFTDKIVEKMVFNKMDPVKIYLGYSEENDIVFDGYIKRTVNTGNVSNDEIIAKDEMIKLEETKITQTFLNISPQEIIKYGLDEAGIQNYELKSQIFAKKPAIPVYEKNIIQLIEEVHRYWNIKEYFYFDRDKKFYWGTKPKQDKVYEFQYGENIINLTFENGFWVIETISFPYIKHSHNIKVVHPRIEGTFEVYKVHFSINEEGFPRTKIYFKDS
ncbi:hypothetical protein [Caloranaerobacter sp. DY30410]|uniref:hypothetical protein n=1 Tax=Caloranaerobacter sp. DY30410 TaxID=3238305 RepID=UPI003CFE5B16